MRSFLPIELAFARTLHRFQGLTAGEVDEGKLPNPFPVIICDPDVKAVEGRATGFLYTMLTRATTLGDPNGLNSAIYFVGPNLTKERIKEVTQKSNSNQTLTNVKRRENWVTYLESNVIDDTDIHKDHMEHIFEWSQNTISYDDLYRRTKNYVEAKRDCLTQTQHH